MIRVRAARLTDLDDLIHLGKLAGPGFTSMNVKPEQLEARLGKAVKSFQGPSEISPDKAYVLFLEDMTKGQIIGMSAVKAQIGIKDPFFNFRILKLGQKSSVTDRRYDMDVLMVVNEHAGASEVGSLFVREDRRGGGTGRLISQARYMLIATDQARFAGMVISELRGVVDDTGYSPFWSAIGQKFFQMDFDEADKISARKDTQFIADLMPKYPIYAALLPEETQAVIGKAHPKGKGALRFLEQEGFAYHNLIDIFDGGPSMQVQKKNIRTVRESYVVMTMAGDTSTDQAQDALVSNEKISEFCCVWQKIVVLNDQVAILSEEGLQALGVETGDMVRIWRQPQGKKADHKR